MTGVGNLRPEEVPPIVLDSSVGVALLRNEPSAAEIRSALGQWAQLDRDLFVPSVFWLEILNPLARRYRYAGEDLLRAIDELEGLTITTIDPDRPLILLTIHHIERYGLSAYDAHYLALAVQLGADLATLDHDLAHAAGLRTIPLDGGHRLHEAPAVYAHDVTWPRYKEASAYLAKLQAEALAGRPR